MSRRRSAGAAAAAASPNDDISSVISAEFAAAAAAGAAPMEDEGDLAEEKEPGAAAAAAPAAAARGRAGRAAAAAAAAAAAEPEEDQAEMLKRFTSGMSWAPISAACKEMQNQVAAELRELRGLHDGLIREATAAIKRAGMAKENDNPCKASVARCRSSLEALVAKESYLSAHTEALRLASEAVNKGDVPYNVDWNGYLLQLDEDEENKPANKAKHEAALQKALKDFEDACWSVHHSGEDRGDSDVQAVSSNSSIGLKDPFTLDWLFEPVRAPECGHRYSRAAVESSLQQAHWTFASRHRVAREDWVFSPDFQMPCQYAGCKKLISLNSLIPDPEAVRLVARAKIEEQRNQAAGPAAAAGAGSSAAAAAAAGARRKRGTIKEEKGTAEAAGASFDLTQQDDGMEDDGAGAAAPTAAAAAAASSPARRAAARR